MNTNNKEAMELLKIARGRLTVLHKDTAEMVNLAIELLQDNEVQESTCLCKEDNCPNCEYVGCKHVKPSSKVEKLKELQRRFSTNLDYGAQWADLVKILNVLIEDEE